MIVCFSHAKVGHRQALILKKPPDGGFFFLYDLVIETPVHRKTPQKLAGFFIAGHREVMIADAIYGIWQLICEHMLISLLNTMG
jgi:hypothetical protein